MAAAPTVRTEAPSVHPDALSFGPPGRPGVGAPARGGPVTCAEGHAWRCTGYFRGKRPEDLDCTTPIEMVCDACSERVVWRCRSHRSKRCRPCATRYRRLVRDVAYSGMSQKRPGLGHYYLATFTSPSDIGQHCYVKSCRSRDGSCSHTKCPCTPPGGVDLAVWNAACGKAWNRLRTALRRCYPGLEFFRAVEVQDGKRLEVGTGRGALHLHVIVYAPHGLGSVVELRALAMAAGFGHSVDLVEIQPGSRKAAYYVSKYVGKACDEREAVPWHRTRGREPDRRVPDPVADSLELALSVLGDSASQVSGPLGWRAVPEARPEWQSEDGCWVVTDDEGEILRAWSPVRVVTLATHRNWSQSKGWGSSMREALVRSAAFASARAERDRQDRDGPEGDPASPLALAGAPPGPL